MSEIGASSVHASFAVLRAAIVDHPDGGSASHDEIGALLAAHAERHGVNGVVFVVKNLAAQALAAVDACTAEGQTIDDWLERQERRALLLEDEDRPGS